jgi:hypothetical protein
VNSAPEGFLPRTSAPSLRRVEHTYEILEPDERTARETARRLAASRFDLELDEVGVTAAAPLTEDDDTVGYLVSLQVR